MGGRFFLKGSTPAVLGDYWAGPSHVLRRVARPGSRRGLSVATFLKRSGVVENLFGGRQEKLENGVSSGQGRGACTPRRIRADSIRSQIMKNRQAALHRMTRETVCR